MKPASGDGSTVIGADSPVPSGDGKESTLRTQAAVLGIRRMIMQRKLWPGQQIRQEEIAAALGMSKSPVREALKSLQADGLVRHSPNRGYFISEVTAEGLREIYTMRRALETIVYLELPPVDSSVIAGLRAINRAINDSPVDEAPYQFLLLNRQFHFEIFAASGLDLVVGEIERLWRISDSYRALFSHEFFLTSKSKVVGEHNKMIAALKAHDLAGLVEIADHHRATIETKLAQMLPAAGGQAATPSL